MDKSIVSPFFDSRCIYALQCISVIGQNRRSITQTQLIRPVSTACRLYGRPTRVALLRRRKPISFTVNCNSIKPPESEGVNYIDR